MDYTAHTTITMLCWFRKTLPRLLPSASVSGEYVNLLKRFPGMNERIELADEKVVHRVAGKWYSNSRDFSAKCGIVVVDQVIEHHVCRRPVGRLASLAITHQRQEWGKHYNHFSFMCTLHNRIKKAPYCISIAIIEWLTAKCEEACDFILICGMFHERMRKMVIGERIHK